MSGAPLNKLVSDRSGAVRLLEQSWRGALKYWKTRPVLIRCLPVLPGQCRKTATEPRLPSLVQAHLGIPVSAEANQEKGLICIKPRTLSWCPICTFFACQRRLEGDIYRWAKVPKPALTYSVNKRNALA